MPFDQNFSEVSDKVLPTFMDNTTDVNYTFVADTYDPNAVYTDPVWRCYRITNANGTLVFAINPLTNKHESAPVLRANLVATYTY